MPQRSSIFRLRSLKVRGVIDFDMLKVGNVLPMTDPEALAMKSKKWSPRRTESEDGFQPFPLAGHILHFSGEIVEVREATPGRDGPRSRALIAAS